MGFSPRDDQHVIYCIQEKFFLHNYPIHSYIYVYTYTFIHIQLIFYYQVTYSNELCKICNDYLLYLLHVNTEIEFRIKIDPCANLFNEEQFLGVL